MKPIILDAFMVYAIDADLLDHPFVQSFEFFKQFAKENYEGDIELASILTLLNAAREIRVGADYGIYNNVIAKYYKITNN